MSFRAPIIVSPYRLGVQLILLMDHFAAVYMSVEDLIEVFPALLGFTKDFLLQAASFKNLFLVMLR